jgi:outer membrane lipoprotein-sorting protein
MLISLSAAAFALAGAAGNAAPSPAPLTAEDRQDVARIVDYLQALTTARSRFVQTDARGAQSEGTFYLQRPGRARIEYDSPSGLVIAADGRSVTEVDRRLKTKHVYSLGSTPLELILAPRIQLDHGVVVRQVTHDRGSLTLIAEAAHRRGRIGLVFNEAPLSLSGWTLEDGRGGATKVRLAGLTHTPPHEAGFFELPDPRSTPASAPDAEPGPGPRAD